MDGSPGTDGSRRTPDALLAAFTVALKVFIIQASSLHFSEEPQSQDALHGRSAILRCELSGPQDMLFWWTQDGRRVQDSNRRFQEGSNLKFTAVDRHEDVGSFQCVASSSSTGESLTSANASINIKWLESGPITMNEPASEAELEEAERIVLQCHIDGHPRPSSKWFKDGGQLDRKDRILTLTNLSTGDSGIYSCCAQNAAGKVCSNNNITLNIFDKSVPRVLVAPVDQVVLRNEEAVFHCQFRAKPPPRIDWFHDAEPINKSQVVVYANGTLHISQVQQRSTGVYKCVAQYGENKQVHVEAVLRIAEIGDMGGRLLRVFSAGRSRRVRCDPPRGQPEPQVWWERAGARVGSEGRVYQRDGDLIFSPANRSDSGLYTCVARNTAGQKQQELLVTVATSPEWIVRPQDTHVEEGQPGFLHCQALSTPEPRVTWYRKSAAISEEGSRYKLFSNGTLRINSAEVNDAQTYSCVCVTEAGSLTGHARVHILDGADLPSHVSQMDGVLLFRTVTRADGGNYTCVASSSSSGESDLSPLSLHWMLSLSDFSLSSSSSRFQKMPNGSLVISEVSTEDTGIYTCVAGNICSIRDTAAQLYVVEKPVHPRTEDEDKSQFKMFQTIALSVAVAVAYIIAVLGLMFYCKQRRKNKRLQKNSAGEEPEMECLNGGAVQLNGHRMSEIREEVALTTIGPSANSEKQQSCGDKLHFPRAHLQTITTLGRGVFGEVFLAKARSIEQAETETLVLVKSLESSEETHRSEFRRELEMFSRLHHPHVVRLLGICRESQPHYMILEYVDLGDLKQFLRISKSSDEKLKPHPISTKTKVSICAQVAHGMQHLSNKGFVHKDLAARNCLISGQRHVKVSALGLSKDVYNSEYYEHRQVWIPLRWLASEGVFEGEFSGRTDVWAFGVLMWEVFSLGELPYLALSDQQVLEGLQAGTLRLSPPAKCPAHVCSLMSRCWASSPKERPTFSEILQILTDSPTDTKV
ncbi:inactive tyrosine-protein kinase 7 [Puntigrus tetrazona]|uniref:inactive tyrosine-protein kinase 7 n=1 Tax=Puntigrus tetrazona TaxID=1606681 RepID=UPI001C8AE54D|nr:inactive tyrosine-protein kinase 7 [Puntigrus tetrazona]